LPCCIAHGGHSISVCQPSFDRYQIICLVTDERVRTTSPRLVPENDACESSQPREQRRHTQRPTNATQTLQSPRGPCILYHSISVSVEINAELPYRIHTHTHTATLCSTRRQHFPSIQVTRGWVISKAVRVYMRRLHDFLQCSGAVGWAAGKGIRPVKK